MHRPVAAIAALSFGIVLGPPAAAGDLVASGFEPGQAWHGTTWVASAAWPSAFKGGYALEVRDSQQFKKWPASGTISEPLLSIRLHFRVQSDNLSLDPNHDGAPDEHITLVGVQPKTSNGKRPLVALKRDDDVLILRIEDYSALTLLRDAVVVPDRWHVLDLLLDQANTRMVVALDGLTVYDDAHADVDLGSTFSEVDLGIVYSQKNGHRLWFDDVRIRNSGGLQGPEIDAHATVTPGVGTVPLTVNFVLNSSAGSPTVEWDFEGDGIFDATGATASKTYSTAGTFRPVARVTGASSNRAAAYPPIIHAQGSNAPTVVLQQVGGGTIDLPFPRVLEFRADATPASGAKVVRVEFDWAGGGVYGWNGRTAWSRGAALVVHLPHEFRFDTTEGIVRAKVTDDLGRVGTAELLVTLPVGPGQPTIPPRDPRAGIYTTAGWKEIFVDRNRVFPAWLAGVDVGAFLEWSAIEKSDGVFDFGPLDGSDPYTYDGRIHEIIDGGKNVVLHHRTPFPPWLLTKVGKSVKKNPEGSYYPQFWDPRHLGYVDRFVRASASNLRALIAANPGWSNRFVVSRGQFFAVDSELLPTGKLPVVAFPGTSVSMQLTSANFTPPASGAYPVDFSPELATVYAANVRAIYEDAFAPLGVPGVYKPHAGGWYNGSDAPRADDDFRRAIANAAQGLFVTGARAETEHDHWFLGFTDRGLARGFHEASNNAASQPLGTVQWEYWTLLAELNCGSEFVGTYGTRVWLLEYQADHDVEPLHAFVNRHVGWKSHPTAAPAAWIALKPQTAPPGEKAFTTGNYGALLTERADDDGIDVSSVGSVRYAYTGPTNLGHPAVLNEPMLWARTCPPAGRLEFDVDDALRASHPSNHFNLEVVFLDSYQGRFLVTFKNQRGQVKSLVAPMSGDGKWHRVDLELIGAELHDDLGPGIDFAIQADAQATTFHRLVLTPL